MMKKLTMAEALEQAARIIETPGKWTQGALARNIEGYPELYWAPTAVCWCASGALALVLKQHEQIHEDYPKEPSIWMKIHGEFSAKYGHSMPFTNDSGEFTANEMAAALRGLAA